MKAIAKYLSIFLFSVIIISKASAQNMSAVNNMLNRQFMNQQMQMSMLSLNNNQYNRSFTFVVTMADSTQKIVDSKIYSDASLHKAYLLFVDKSYPRSDTNRRKKIFANQTLRISRDLFGGKKVEGIANDTCWMFKTISGPISAYSFLSDGYLPFVALQFNDGPIEKFNEEHLKKVVSTNIDALESARKKDYLKAIQKYNRNLKKMAQR
ncbi:hypothetical protein [Mucilaginibacter sp.]|uniref:hypothetical protein n=1 Tax=Mucilaginibacter sp. TaxID=1882438 RepID=UPI0026335C58|nr:hypothetical protein [Mucilaginibacter sp.]